MSYLQAARASVVSAAYGRKRVDSFCQRISSGCSKHKALVPEVEGIAWGQTSGAAAGAEMTIPESTALLCESLRHLSSQKKEIFQALAETLMILIHADLCKPRPRIPSLSKFYRRVPGLTEAGIKMGTFTWRQSSDCC